MDLQRRPLTRAHLARFTQGHVRVGAAGDPATATLVTPAEEDKYIHSVARAADQLRDAIPPKLAIGAPTFASQVAAGDPYWTPENRKKYAEVFEFYKWKQELNDHVEQWDKRTILDEAGRFIAGVVVGRSLPAGAAAVYTVNDWADKTAGFDRNLKVWAKRLLDAKIVKPGDMPQDLVERPQSWWNGSDDNDPGFGWKKVLLDLLKPVVIVGAVGLGLIVAVNVVPPLLAARAARKAAA